MGKRKMWYRHVSRDKETDAKMSYSIFCLAILLLDNVVYAQDKLGTAGPYHSFPTMNRVLGQLLN